MEQTVSLENLPFAERIPTIIAGLFGSAVAAVFLPRFTLRALAGTFIAGEGCATFLAPSVNDLLAVSNENFRGSIAFLIGVFGMAFVIGLLKWGERFKKDPLQAIQDLKDLRK